MNELVDAMTAINPRKRPAIEDVVAEFSRIRKSLSASVMVEVKSYIN